MNTSIYFVVLCLLALWIQLPSVYMYQCYSNPPAVETQSLLDLYYATDGPHWLHPWPIPSNTSANVTSIPCESWDGLVCYTIDNECRVIALELSHNNLAGAIPPSLGNLTALQYTYLNNNQLTGSLPPSLGGLRNLVELYLYDNALTGPWPASFGNLSQLTFIYASSNRLSGSLPASIVNLTALVSLALRDNQLTGRLPETLVQLPQLNSLALGVNLFTGPLTTTVWSPALQYLDLSACSFTGAVPLALLQLPLQYLDLSQNALSGSLPAALWNTSVAQPLLNDNRLPGAFPPRGDRGCAMRSVSVSANLLTGRLPSDLATCVRLTAWFASDMALTGPLTVVVASNALTGPVADVFAASNASGLILNAAYNALTGTLPVASLLRGAYASLVLTDNCLAGTLAAAA
eukprot:gene24959-26945_t